MQLPRFHILVALCFSLICCARNGSAQNEQVPRNATIKVEQGRKSKELIKKAKDTCRVNVPKGISYALASYRLAKKSENDTLILSASKTLGIVYKMLEKIDSSRYYSKVGIKYADKISDSRTAAVLTTLVALSYAEVGQYDVAYTYFDHAEKRYQTLNKDSIDPTYFFFKLNKSSLFNELTLYDLMLKELFEAERIADSISDDNFSGQILAAIAVAYKKSNNLEKSILYNKKSLKYFRKGEIDQAITFKNIGNNFSALGVVDSALFYYKNARNVFVNRKASLVSFYKLDIAQAEMFLENDMPREASNLLFEINDSELGNKERAKVNLLKSKMSLVPSEKLIYAKESLKYSVLASDILIQKESYYLLYEHYKKQNNFSDALSNYESYQALEDSIFNREKSKAIQKVVLQKVVDEKDAEIRLNTLIFEKDKAEKDKTILFVVLALVIILFILGFLYFRYLSQKQKTKIEIQAKKILENENEGIKNELVQVAFESDRNFEVLKGTKDQLKKIKQSSDKDVQINSLFALINRFVAAETDKRNYQDKLNEVREDFFEKASANVKLTKTEKKMAALLKLDLSTKEIATILNVTDSTIEVYRSRLRKKLEIEKECSLSDYFNNL